MDVCLFMICVLHVLITGIKGSFPQDEYKAGDTAELDCTRLANYATVSWKVYLGRPTISIICTQAKSNGAGCLDPHLIPPEYRGRLLPDRYASLKMVNLTGSDTNQYNATVYQNMDKCEFVVKVIVSSPEVPSIPAPPPVIETHLTQLQCQPASTTNGTLLYTWQKNGQAHGQETGTDTLRFLSTNRTDAGSYTCSIRNVVGSSGYSQAVTLVVQYPPDVGPVILPAPGSTPVIRYQGDAADWICQVQGGNPAANLSWPCDGLTSTPGESGTTVTRRLIGKYSRLQNSKTCTCTADHSAWLDRREAALKFNIYYPPGTPSVTLNKQHLLENQTYTATCDVSDMGNPQATYRWTFPGRQLGNQRTQQLTVTKADHNLQLTCQLSNNFTEHKTVEVRNSITLNVQFSPRISLPDTYTKKENGSVDLVCSTQSNPPATDDHYRWTRGQTPVSPPCRSTCTIRDLTKDDAGQYTCTVSVTPQGGYPTLTASSTTTLIVQYLSPPTVFNKETTEGDPVTLTCRASGVPAIYTYSKWTHTGPYVEGTRTIGETGAGEETRLIISKATYTDTGDYTCYSSNLVDSKQASGRLTVRFAPRSNNHPGGTRVVYTELHSTTTLSVSVFAYPTPVSFSWFMEVNTTLVEMQHTRGKYEISSGAESSRLTVINITREEFANYTVNATNNVQNGSLFEFRISPRGCPEVPMLDEITVTAVSIRIRWRPQFEGGYSQKILVRVCNETSTSCDDTVIEDPRYNEEQVTVIESPRVASGTCYSVTVQAENAHNGGCVTSTLDRKVCTKVRPVVKEGKFTVERKDNIALLWWSPPSEDESYDKQMVEQWETGPRTKRSNQACTEAAKCDQTEVTKGTYIFAAEINPSLEYRFTLVLYDGEIPVFSLVATDVIPCPPSGKPCSDQNTAGIIGAFLGGLLVGAITLAVIFGCTLYQKQMLSSYLNTCRKGDKYKEDQEQIGMKVPTTYENMQNTTCEEGNSQGFYTDLNTGQEQHEYEALHGHSNKSCSKKKKENLSKQIKDEPNNAMSAYDNTEVNIPGHSSKEYSALAFNRRDEHAYMDLEVKKKDKKIM